MDPEMLRMDILSFSLPWRSDLIIEQGTQSNSGVSS